MLFGKGKDPEFTPYADPELIQADRERIHRSVDRLGLDPDRFIIVGGAVLNAYGIRPAADVDLVATAKTLHDIYDNDLKTPSGIAVSAHPARTHVLSVKPSEDRRYMGVDIITNYDLTRHGHRTSYDNNFMAELAEREDRFGKFHISSPEEMLHQYVTKRRSDRRAKQDKTRVEAYLRSTQGKNPAPQR